MKKILSIVLAILIAASTAAVVSAQVPEAGIDEQSLVFELPVVTDIEAEWNGEILISIWGGLRFNPENVAVTVFFEDSEPEVLERWSGSVSGGNQGSSAWEVFWIFDRETNVVTFFYSDSNLWDAFWGEQDFGCCCEVTDEAYEAFRATLPQDSFTVPADFMDEFFASTPVFPLDEAVAITRDGDRVFSFTPEESGIHWLSTANGDILVRIFDENLQHLHGEWMWSTRRIALPLEAGNTYFIYFQSVSRPGDVTLTFSGEAAVWCEDCGSYWCSSGNWTPPPANWLQRLSRWFWNLNIVWVIEDLGWRMSHNLLGRIIISPFVAMFWIPILVMELFAWINWGGWIR